MFIVHEKKVWISRLYLPTIQNACSSAVIYDGEGILLYLPTIQNACSSIKNMIFSLNSCTYPLFRMHVHRRVAIMFCHNVVLTHYSECMFIFLSFINTTNGVVLTHYSECMFILEKSMEPRFSVVLTHYSECMFIVGCHSCIQCRVVLTHYSECMFIY